MWCRPRAAAVRRAPVRPAAVGSIAIVVRVRRVVVAVTRVEAGAVSVRRVAVMRVVRIVGVVRRVRVIVIRIAEREREAGVPRFIGVAFNGGGARLLLGGHDFDQGFSASRLAQAADVVGLQIESQVLLDDSPDDLLLIDPRVHEGEDVVDSHDPRRSVGCRRGGTGQESERDDECNSNKRKNRGDVEGRGSLHAILSKAAGAGCFQHTPIPATSPGRGGKGYGPHLPLMTSRGTRTRSVEAGPPLFQTPTARMLFPVCSSGMDAEMSIGVPKFGAAPLLDSCSAASVFQFGAPAGMDARATSTPLIYATKPSS